jgi:hypothetical protein
VSALEGGRLRVYICHPYSADPEGNVRAVRAICRAVVEEGHLPIAPHLYLPAFVDEATERALALALCLELVTMCDEVWVYGDEPTSGMRQEILHAARLGILCREKKVIDF